MNDGAYLDGNITTLAMVSFISEVEDVQKLRKTIKIVWVLCALLSIVAFVVIVVFLGDGYHEIGMLIHLDRQGSCFYLDEDSGEVISQGTLVISGFGNLDSQVFSGSFLTSQYSNPEQQKLTTFSILRDSGDFRQILCMEATEYEKGVIDGAIIYDTTLCDFRYRMYVSARDASFLLIRIDRLDGTGIVAVCADSEQEAQEQYQWFLSEKVRDN